jgi:hypothetical protein
MMEKAITLLYLDFAYLPDLVYVPRNSKSKDLLMGDPPFPFVVPFLSANEPRAPRERESRQWLTDNGG